MLTNIECIQLALLRQCSPSSKIVFAGRERWMGLYTYNFLSLLLSSWL